MAVSEKASSARVAPRSLIRAAAVSRMMSRHGARRGGDGSRRCHVAYGAVADLEGLHRFVGSDGQVRARRQVHPGPQEHVAMVGEVDRRDLELLAPDVRPDIQLGPVGEREHAHVLAWPDPAVVTGSTTPAVGGLVPTGRIRREARTRAPWPVAFSSSRRAPPNAASNRCCSMASSRVIVCRRLREASGPGSSRTLPAIDRFLDGRDDQPFAELAQRSDPGSRGPPGSCGRCRCAGSGTGTAKAEKPSRRCAAARPSPSRRRTAGPGARTRRRPRA